MTIRSIFEKLHADAVVVSTLHTKPFFKSWPDTYNDTRTIVIVFFIICTLHYTLLQIFKKNQTSLKLKDSKETMRLSYQATNFIVNLSLAILGIYTIFNSKKPLTLLHPFYESDILVRISGYTQYTYFAAFQLGYNFWALPVGILFVDESPFMILHHVAVLSSTVLACYSSTAYNYASVYIFGVAEMSSVPLAIMNYLKYHREWTKKHFESGYGVIKIVFAVSFLILRVFIATPLILDLLRSSFLVIWTLILFAIHGNSNVNVAVDVGLIKIIICGSNFILMCCLGFLQVSYSKSVHEYDVV